MLEDEGIDSYILQVTEVVNGIRGISGKWDEDGVVKKALRSLPKYYSSKVFAIEERKDLDKYIMDQLYGAFVAFEMGEFELDNSKKEATFKSSKQT